MEPVEAPNPGGHTNHPLVQRTSYESQVTYPDSFRPYLEVSYMYFKFWLYAVKGRQSFVHCGYRIEIALRICTDRQSNFRFTAKFAKAAALTYLCRLAAVAQLGRCSIQRTMRASALHRAAASARLDWL